MLRFSLFSDYYHSFWQFEKKVIDRIKETMGFMPSLDYVEFHLADHCNLNCRGCGHFSPIADQHFSNLNVFHRDIKRLSGLFSNIKIIVLMGGEPLLNPQIDQFIYASRSFFPQAEIQIFTNGILLPKMKESFWTACKACRITIDITVYPPLVEQESNVVNLIRSHQLKVQTHRINTFHAFFNRKGNTDGKKAFKKCRLRWYTPMLRDGKIYICPKAATIHYFNQKFSLNIPESGAFDINSPDLTGWDVKEQLDKAASLCNYCSLGWDTIPVFPWEVSKRILTDWEPMKS